MLDAIGNELNIGDVVKWFPRNRAVMFGEATVVREKWCIVKISYTPTYSSEHRFYMRASLRIVKYASAF